MANAEAGNSEEGSAIVDFVMFGGLALLMVMALIQLVLVLHVRNVVLDAAASGAYYGALADRGPEDARRRAEELLDSALGGGYAAEVSVNQGRWRGGAVLEVHIAAELPLFGLIGPSEALEVTGRAPLV